MRALPLAAACLLLAGACTHTPVENPALTTTTIAYDVVSGGSTHLEVTDVDLPYRARTRTFAGPSTSSAVTGGFAWTEDALYLLGPDGSKRTGTIPPGRPGPVGNLRTGLPLAAQLGLVDRGGTATVAGHGCRWWTSRKPLDSEDPRPGTTRDRARSCVDDDGWVLAVVWTIDGQVAVRRTARSVTTTPALTDRELFGGPAPTGGVTLVNVRVLDKPADPPLGVRALAPLGFRFDKAALTVRTEGPRGAASLTSDLAVFRDDDGHLAVLTEDQPQLSRAQLPARGRRVRVGALGTGRLDATFAGPRLRVLLPDNVLLTLTGPLDSDALLAWGRALRLR